MNIDYYSNQNFNLPEVGVVLEELKYSNTNNVAKIFIPSMFPTLQKSLPYDKSQPKESTANIVNKNDSLKNYINGFTESNYIDMTIPKYIAYEFDNIIPKDTKLIIVFVGGDLNKPRVIGVY